MAEEPKTAKRLKPPYTTEIFSNTAVFRTIAGQLPLHQAYIDGFQAYWNGSGNVVTSLPLATELPGWVPGNRAGAVFRLSSRQAVQPRVMGRRTEQEDKNRNHECPGCQERCYLDPSRCLLVMNGSKNSAFNSQLNKNGSDNVQYLIPILSHDFQEQVSIELSSSYHLKESC